MFNELFTAPSSPVFAAITVGFICFIKPTQHIFKPFGKRTGDNLTVRGWSREKFVEHLRLLYPQLSNAADKSYLEMIKEIPFQYDLDNPVVELKFQSELSKIVRTLRLSYRCGRSRGSKTSLFQLG